ncbi:MAG: HD domain-containing phosphohydrolase [Nitrospiria bacterium]
MRGKILFIDSEESILGVRPKYKEIFRQIVHLMIRETGADLVCFSCHNATHEPVFHEVKTTPAGAHQEIYSFIQWMKTRFEHLKTPLLITGLEEECLDVVEQTRSVQYSSVMVYPLVSKFHSMGFLICGKVSGKNHFFARDLELFSIVGNQLATVLENDRLIDDLENAHFESLKGLASAIEAKDTYTSGHCDRLVDHSLLMADRLKLLDQEKKYLRCGAALHDIGKIGIKESILGKPEKLTSAEYEEMKRHPKIGADILQNINFLKPVIPIIYHHQECYDGSGYPEGLSGEQIPLGSRIVAILDTFDAMTTDRPYRKALSVRRAIDELTRYAGKQFDPYLVKVFTGLIQEKT